MDDVLDFFEKMHALANNTAASVLPGVPLALMAENIKPEEPVLTKPSLTSQTGTG